VVAALTKSLAEMHKLVNDDGSKAEGGEHGGGCGLMLDRTKKDYVELAASGNLQFGGSQAFTIEAWVKPMLSNKDMVIVSKYNRGKWGQYFVKLLPSGHVFFHREVAPWGQKSQATLPAGQFSHVAVTYGDGRANIYVNGTKSASQKEGPQDNNPETPVLFGTMQEKGTRIDHFHGVLDELRVWEIERKPEQLKQGMHVSLTGSEDGLVGYWTFDECAGGRVRDKLGRHDGLRRGGTWAQSPVRLKSYHANFGCTDSLC